MTTPLTKLIEENKERPIAEAPRDGRKLLLSWQYDLPHAPTKLTGLVEGWWNGKAWETDEGVVADQGYYTHFYPLPDDRLARCFEILLNAALSAKEQNHIYEAAADIEIALQEITAIAEGKDNA